MPWFKLLCITAVTPPATLRQGILASSTKPQYNDFFYHLLNAIVSTSRISKTSKQLQTFTSCPFAHYR